MSRHAYVVVSRLLILSPAIGHAQERGIGGTVDGGIPTALADGGVPSSDVVAPLPANAGITATAAAPAKPGGGDAGGGVSDSKSSKVTLELPQWAPFGKLSFENQKGQIEAGLEFNWMLNSQVREVLKNLSENLWKQAFPHGNVGTPHIIPAKPASPEPIVLQYFTPRILVDVPFMSDDSTVARIDSTVSKWQLGITLDYRYIEWLIGTKPTDPALVFHEVYTSLEGKLSSNNYDYYPKGGSTKSSVTDEDYTLKLLALYEYAAPSIHTAPQIELGYTRSSKAANAVPVFTMGGMTMMPVVGRSLIVNPPTATPTAYARLSLLGLGTNSVGFGLSALYSVAGASNDVIPGAGAQRLNLELWGYYFPVQAHITNTRIGLAPFVSILLAGTDSMASTFFGALVEVKTATTDLVY